MANLTQKEQQFIALLATGTDIQVSLKNDDGDLEAVRALEEKGVVILMEIQGGAAVTPVLNLTSYESGFLKSLNGHGEVCVYPQNSDDPTVSIVTGLHNKGIVWTETKPDGAIIVSLAKWMDPKAVEAHLVTQLSHFDKKVLEAVPGQGSEPAKCRAVAAGVYDRIATNPENDLVWYALVRLGDVRLVNKETKDGYGYYSRPTA